MPSSLPSHVPLIAVDIGNTSLRIGIFLLSSDNGLPWPESTLVLPTRGEDWSALTAFPLPQGAAWRVVSVHRDAERRLAARVAECDPAADYRRLTWQDLPLDIRLPRPERVGMDRLAAVVAANVLRDAHRPAAVVVSGTAITINWINQEGAFLGGAILPGMQMAAEALAGGTDLLPHLPLGEAPEAPKVCGDSTEMALCSGIHWGTVGAVRHLVRRMAADHGARPQVFLSGGDAARIAPWLGRGFQLVPNLGLCGVAVAARFA